MVSLLMCILCGAAVFLAAPAATAAPEYPSAKPAVLSSNNFPCSNCHSGMTPDSSRRPLSFHAEIKVNKHGEQRMWCHGCHDAADRDHLRLAGGEKVPFPELHRLCGQCHENIYRHWKAGVHGKRTGSWDGENRHYLCTQCHNPHSPRFKPLKPEPAPRRPVQTLRSGS
jgi:hypothetical protein